MEIKSIHIDFEKNLLEINGKAVNKPTVVYLPSDTPGWYNSKLFASPEGSKPKAYDQIKVVFKSDQQRKKQYTSLGGRTHGNTENY